MINERKIIAELGLKPSIAAELEFFVSPRYARGSEQEKLFMVAILAALKEQHIEIYSFLPEVCEGQFEISTVAGTAEKTISDINAIKEVLKRVTKRLKMQLDLSAKPDVNLPGSGFHIHVNLFNDKGKNVYSRIKNKSEESKYMLYSVGGLCETMLGSFLHFAPYEDSYRRFTAKTNFVQNEDLPLSAYNNSPTNVSWGGNNRTTAIRIPSSTISEQIRRIEHRVSGVDADPEEAINAVLRGIYKGITEKITPPERIFGNAYDPQYTKSLKKFPRSLAEAKLYFDHV